MKLYSNRIVLFMLLASFSITILAKNCAPCQTSVTPTYVTRSQGTNNVWKVIGMSDHTHLFNTCGWWGTFNLGLEYTKSFRPSGIAHCLFGSDLVGSDCNTILVQGHNVQDRNEIAWLADYFYLPSDYNGSISFKPKIQNTNMHIDFYLGLDEWMQNLYFRSYGTLTHTRWSLNPCENIITSGLDAYPAGYDSPERIETSSLLNSALDFFNGATIADGVSSVNFKPLQYGKLSRQSQSKTSFSGLWFELGLDFINHCDYHCGIGFVCGAPTGNQRHAQYAFQPIIGNAKHWAIGGVVTGHYTFWHSCNEDQSLGLYFDANITHLVSSKEQRTFDLCNKPNSRYALAMRLGENITDNLATLNVAPGMPTATPTEITPATKQFASEFSSVANLTTFDTKVSINVQADIAANLTYTSCNWSWDLGYNFWGRSCEKIEIIPSCDNNNRLENECWGLKGHTHTFGFVATDAAGAAGFTEGTNPVALNATQSQSDIHNGATGQIFSANTNTDSPCPAYASVNGTTYAALINQANTTFANGTPTNASKKPVRITMADVNIQETRGMSHKLFTHINYTWNCNCIVPYLGIGGSAEFGKNDSKACTPETPSSLVCDPTQCSPCLDCALSQWAVWIKGGISWR